MARACCSRTSRRVASVPKTTLRHQYNGKPTGAFAIQLLPGANALNVAEAVRAKMTSCSPVFPSGVTWFSPYDSTTFVKISIQEVVQDPV